MEKIFVKRFPDPFTGSKSDLVLRHTCGGPVEAGSGDSGLVWCWDCTSKSKAKAPTHFLHAFFLAARTGSGTKVEVMTKESSEDEGIVEVVAYNDDDHLLSLITLTA